MGLSVVSLFAGIGGFDVGLAGAGHATALFCENSPAAQAVLAHRFPGIGVVPDIRDMDDLPPGTDLVTAGFPCQDISSGGMKAGLEGLRSGLVRKVFDLLERRPAPWVVIENVRNMLYLGGGEAMKYIVESFERLGYRWAYRLVDTLFFGLPQRRRRVFFVASLEGDPRDVLLADDAPAEEPDLDPSLPTGFYWTEGRRALCLVADGVPTIKRVSTPAVLWPDGSVRAIDIRDQERLQGFEPDWTSSSPKRARQDLAGNAVSVPVAEWLGQRLASPGRYTAAGDRPVDGTWPTAAWSMGERIGPPWASRAARFASQVSTSPLGRPRHHLADFLQYDLPLLSARGTRGFLDRLSCGCMRPPDWFRSAVERHLAVVEAVVR